MLPELLERAGDREEGQRCQQTSAKVDVKASAIVIMWNLDLLGAAVCVVVAPPVVLSNARAKFPTEGSNSETMSESRKTRIVADRVMRYSLAQC